MKDSRLWTTKLEFIESKTGKQIQDYYNLISDNPDKDIVATQIFQNEHRFDVFFYVKYRFGDIKGL